MEWIELSAAARVKKKKGDKTKTLIADSGNEITTFKGIVLRVVDWI